MRRALRDVSIGTLALAVTGTVGAVVAAIIWEFRLFSTIPHGDALAHFAFGLAFAAGLWWVGALTDVPRSVRMAVILCLGLSAAVGWELGEFYYWDEPQKFRSWEHYSEDTVFDVVLLLFAAVTSFEIADWRRRRREQRE